jgi:hypothetical protein
MADSRNEFPPSVNVGRLVERTSSKGNVYLSGFFGSMRITLLKSKDVDAEGRPCWDLMIGGSPTRDRAGNTAGRKADAERPRAKLAPDSSIAHTVNDEIPF